MAGTGWAAPLREALLDLLFPKRCVSCGRFGAFLCPVCRGGLVPAAGERCPRCWRPSPGGARCRECAGEGTLAALRSAYVFGGPSRDLVHALKYGHVTALASLMAEPLAEAAALLPERPAVVVPVPLHRRRLRERGYNQADLLGREVARRLGVRAAPEALVRRRATRPQPATQSAEERHRNVQDAFLCPRPYLIAGSVVVLIDDVTTTGATLASCAAELRRCGAARVYGLTFTIED
ncbi:MAG TPA: ComF family protein [Dehalococcoidia bacterium]